MGLDRRLLGARGCPSDRRRAAGLAVAAFAAIIVVSAILSQFLDAGDEQGLVPKAWDSSRAAPFIANALVVAIVAPFVEELLYRGLGYGLLTQFISALPAILITGLAFGLAHGLVLGLPVLAFFGVTLAWLRWQTGSVYPGMVVHGIFNALALVAGGAQVSERFDEIRRQITANDEAIVAAVNHRLELVAALWELKAELGLDTVDPDRERRLRETLAGANAGPLSAEGLDRLVTDLLDLTKKELGA